MTAAAAKKVWSGAAALRRSLVPVDSLEPFPGNARRGDVEAVRASLRRFGQVKPVVVHGKRIVAGHHVVEAARAEGWTHVAVVENEFGSEEEARAFLLADNRTSDLGRYDDELLLAQLGAAREGGLEGTGYGDGDVAALEATLAAARAAAEPPAQFPPLDPDALETEHRCPACHYEWSGSSRPGGDGGEAAV